MLLRSIASAALITLVGAMVPSGASAQSKVNLFEGLSASAPKAGTPFYLVSARGRPVLKLTDYINNHGEVFTPLQPTMRANGRDIPIRLLESTTATKETGIILGDQIKCGDQTCWEVNFATDGVNPNYGLMLLDRNVPLAAGKTMHGCVSEPARSYVNGNRAIWAKLSAGAEGTLPRIVLRPLKGKTNEFQLRAIEIEKNAQGVHALRKEILTNTGTPNSFDDYYITKTDYTCTWWMMNQDQVDLLYMTPEETGIAKESLELGRAGYEENMPFKLYGSNGKFCAKYKQFNSNAGQCPNCTVSFNKDVGSNRMTVVANNNWSGTVLQANAGSSALASGDGRWSSKISGPYSGLPFELTFEHVNAVMTMRMKTRLGTVVGQFRCAD